MRGAENYQDSVVKIDTRSRWFNLLLVGLCFLFLLGIRLEINQPVSGDEPAYLLMTYSMIHDHDLNLSNNYQNKDFQSFAPGYPTIQGSPAPGAAVPLKMYSQHGIGLPVFLLPGFFLYGRAGAILEMVLVATAVIWLTWVWTQRVTRNRKIAYLAAGALAISYFFNDLAGYIYPDMLISALALASLIIVERYYKKPAFQWLLGLTLGFLVLVHVKTLDIILPMLAILSYQLWKSKRKLPWPTILVVAIFVAYYLLTLHKWFGVWTTPTSNNAGGSQFGDNPFMSVSAMLFDSFRGLLVYNPVMLLIFVGLPLWFKKNRRSLLITLVAILPSIAVLSVFYQYNGGDAPVGRYIIDFSPAFIPALAFAMEGLKDFWQRALIVLAAAATFLITFEATIKKFPLVDPGLVQNQQRAPLFAQIQSHTGLALDHLLPKTSQYLFYPTVFIDKHGLLKTMAGWLVVLALLAYGYYLSRPSGFKKISARR